MQNAIPFAEFTGTEHGDGFYTVSKDKLLETMMHLKQEKQFDCLSCLTGIDCGEFFEVAYHLYSYLQNESLTLKVRVEKDDPSVATLSTLWPSANWMERETYDLLGIKFTGHPELKRILLPDDWEGHPLRKDYTEPKQYCGMKTTRL